MSNNGVFALPMLFLPMAEAAWKAFGTLDCDPTRMHMYEFLAWPNEKKPSAVIV